MPKLALQRTLSRCVVLFTLIAPIYATAVELARHDEPGTFCWPMHYAGVVVGTSQEKHVVRLLGPGVRKSVDLDPIRVYIDPARTMTLSVQFVTDHIVGELSLETGVSPTLAAGERRRAVSRAVESGEGWGNWHALRLGSTRDQVRKNLGPPAEVESADVWVYSNACAGELPQSMTLHFLQEKVRRVVFSAPPG